MWILTCGVMKPMHKTILIVIILSSSIFAELDTKDDEYEIFMSENIEKYEEEKLQFKRLAAMWLNSFPIPIGLGSFFVLGDIKGGSIQLTLTCTGFTLMLLNQGIASCYEENCGNAVVFSAGAVMALSGFVYGIIRPFYYDKPEKIANSKSDRFNMAILPSEQGDLKVYLFYSKVF